MNAKTVLVADDDEAILKVLGDLFEHQGYRVLLAEDGLQAVKVIKKHSVDVALLDVRMPSMDGLEVLREIKRFKPDTQVVIITGFADIDNFKNAIHQEGAIDFILKPFKAKEVLQIVDHAIQKEESAKKGKLSAGELRKIEHHTDACFSERTRQLRESQIKYKQIIESSIDGILLVQKGTIAFTNPKILDITGYAKGEIAHRNALAMFHPEDRLLLRSIYAKQPTAPEHHQTTYTARMLKKQGDFFWAEINSINTLWEGEPATLSFIRDISDRKRVEQTLRRYQEELEQRVKERTTELLEINAKLEREIEERKEAERQIQKSKSTLQGVFDGISDPLIMLDTHQVVRAMNKAASDYYQLPFSSAIGKPYKQITRDGSRRCEIPQSALSGETMVYERECVPERLERVFVYPLDDEGNQGSNFLIRISDITEEKLMEKRLVQNEKLASLGLLVSGIAHEINNPNNFIYFNIPILREYLEELVPIIDEHAQTHSDFELFGMPYAEFQQDLWKLLDNMEHGATRINSTVSSLREFSKLRNKGDQRRVDLGELIENAIAICQGQINKMVKSFRTNLPPNLPQIHTEPGALEQILINLLINAAQAADKSKSWIDLKVMTSDSPRAHVVIEISDNGCGMSEETMKNIFEPFFTTKSAGLGTGLGLYICHNLIGSIGGKMEVESKPKKGSTFRIILPITYPKNTRELDQEGNSPKPEE